MTTATAPVRLIRTDDPGVFLAQSRSNPAVRYQVTIGPSGIDATCTCPAANTGKECAHKEAVLERIVEMAAESQDSKALVPAPTRLPMSTSKLVSERTRDLVVRASDSVGIWQKAMELANAMGGANMLPQSWKTPQDAALSLVKGMELGFSTSESMEFLYVINNKVRCEARGMDVLISRQPGCFTYPKEVTNERATVVGVRPNRPPLEVTFTIQDAAKAGLAGKDTWKQWPADLLYAKALARVARRQFADIISGMDIGASLGGEFVDVDSGPFLQGGEYRVTVDDPQVAAPVAPQAPAGEPKPDWWPTFLSQAEEHHWTRAEIGEVIDSPTPGRQAIEKWIADERITGHPVGVIGERIDALRAERAAKAPAPPPESAPVAAPLFETPDPAAAMVKEESLRARLGDFGECSLGYEVHPATRTIEGQGYCDEHAPTGFHPTASARDE